MHVREFIERNYPEYYSIESYPAERTAPFCKVDAPWGMSTITLSGGVEGTRNITK